MLTSGMCRDWFRSWIGLRNGEFAERAPACAAQMPPWLNGPALAAVDGATMLAAPGILGQGGHGSAQRVIDRNAEAVLVHARHHATKIETVIRAPLQDVILPLMNHFVRQGHHGLVLLLRAVALKQNCREADAPSSPLFVGGLWEHMLRSDSADKHARGGGQSPTPFEGNRRQGVTKIPAIQVGPDDE